MAFCSSMSVRQTRLALLCALTFCALNVCVRAQNADLLEVAVAPYKPIRALLADYQPLRIHLEKRLKRPVVLTTTKNLKHFNEALFRGDYPFALAPMHTGRMAQRDHGYIPLLVVSDPLEALVVVGSSSPIKNVGDLAGKTLIAPSPANLTTLWIEHVWNETKATETKRIRFIWAQGGSFINAVVGLLNGEADASLCSSTALNSFSPDIRDRLRVIYRAPPGPSSMTLLAGPKTPPSLAANVAQSILEYAETEEGKRFLKNVYFSSFRLAGADDFRDVDALLPELRRRLMQP